MATCEKLEKCPFYQGKTSMFSKLGSIYKNNFYEGNNYDCARYMVAT